MGGGGGAFRRPLQMRHLPLQLVTMLRSHLFQGKAACPKKPPTQTKSLCTNSLRKLFLLVFCLFKGETKKKKDSLYKLFRNCLRKLCFYLGAWFFGVGLPFTSLVLIPGTLRAANVVFCTRLGGGGGNILSSEFSKLERAVTVDIKNTPRRRLRQGP